MNNKETYRQIATTQNLPVFHQPWWLDMVCPNWNAAIAKEKDAIAIWPYCISQKASLKLLRNPLLTPYLGPLFFYDHALKSQKELLLEDRLYMQLWEQLPNWDFFDVQCVPGYNNFLPFQHKGFSHTQRLTYEIDLSQNEAEIFAAMNASKRNYIRQAERDLHIVEETNDLDFCYQLYQKTLKKKDKNCSTSSSYFFNIISKSVAGNYGQMLVAKNIYDNVIAFIFVVFDHQKMYYLLSAINGQQSHSGAIPLLIWCAIRKAKQMNLSVFDFEGSVDKGIEPFFRSFGGQRQSFLSCANTPSRLWRWKQALIG